MNQLIIVFCLFVILIEIFLIKGQTSENYEQYELIKNDDNDEKLQLTTCRRCKGEYGNVWSGYQTAASPPPVYWPDKTNAEGLQTKTWQNYKTLDSPTEKQQFKQCDDAYRCRQYGVATGVQGKIF